MRRVAGVDSSTQSVKIVLRDLDSGEIISTASRQHPDGSEVDPEFWWKALLEVIEDIGGRSAFSAISIGGQQHGAILLDENGVVLRPAILWNDTRSSVEAEEINHRFPDIARRCGSRLVPSFTVTKLRWILKHEPKIAARVRAVALPHDWLSWKLSGSTDIGDIFTDRSDASGTGYFDPRTNQYLFDILEFAIGHRDLILPRVIAPSGAGYKVDSLVIAAGAGDNAAAALGVGADVGDLILSLGTSGVLSAISATPSLDDSGVVAGFADATGNYLPLVCSLNAAKIFDATAQLLGVDFEEFAELALSAPSGSSGLLFLPHFDGERTPNRPEIQGKLLNLNHHNFTPSNIARSSIEGVIAGLAYAQRAMESQGVVSSRILLLGGAAKNRAVQEVAATLLGRELIVPVSGEYVANGAALQAAWALSDVALRPSWTVEYERVIPPRATDDELLHRYFQALDSL